jgi:hypothetical protein
VLARRQRMDDRIDDLEQRVCHLQNELHSMSNRDEQPRSNNSFGCTYPGLTNEDYARRYAGSPLSFSDRNYGEMENTQNLEELECIDGDQKQKFKKEDVIRPVIKWRRWSVIMVIRNKNKKEDVVKRKIKGQ